MPPLDIDAMAFLAGAGLVDRHFALRWIAAFFHSAGSTLRMSSEEYSALEDLLQVLSTRPVCDWKELITCAYEGRELPPSSDRRAVN